jgi:cellulose biosynthesis protein BcsQ
METPERSSLRCLFLPIRAKCGAILANQRGLAIPLANDNWSLPMDVLAFASRKGGSGKSTLTAHLAVHVHRPSRPCLLIDDDPQGSLTLWNELRGNDALPIKSVKRGIGDIIKKAKRNNVEWVFIDTAPNVSPSVIEAIEAATLVIIPCRPGLFDLDAVQETITYAREARTPYAVVFNAAPPKREDLESPAVTAARECLARLKVPVWGGQITHRAGFSLALNAGQGVKEYEADAGPTAEIARLWQAIDKSVKAIRGARAGTVMHRVAA